VVIVPHADPLQPLPATLHNTPVFDVPSTVAVNCSWPPTNNFAFAGATETVTGGMIVTVPVADFVGSATDVAVTDTVAGLGTADGAVYKPLAVIVPQDDPMQPLPAKDHDTAVLLAFATVAVNCC
jgi:hypothetical protein